MDPLRHVLDRHGRDADEAGQHGGRHLDETIVRQVTRVVGTLGAILAEGSAAGTFRDVPLLAPLGDFADVSRPLVVTAWSWGAGVARFITPTSAVVMAGIAMAV